MEKMMTYKEANAILDSSLSPNNRCLTKQVAIDNGAEEDPLSSFAYNRLVPANKVNKKDTGGGNEGGGSDDSNYGYYTTLGLANLTYTNAIDKEFHDPCWIEFIISSDQTWIGKLHVTVYNGTSVESEFDLPFTIKKCGRYPGPADEPEIEWDESKLNDVGIYVLFGYNVSGGKTDAMRFTCVGFGSEKAATIEVYWSQGWGNKWYVVPVDSDRKYKQKLIMTSFDYGQ